MRRFLPFLMSVLIASALALSSLPANADPTISMSGEGWKVRKTFQGTQFSCDEDRCGGEAIVRFATTKVLSDTEEQLNKPYANIRAIVNGGILYQFGGQDGGMNLTDIRKTTTKDYTAIHLTGQPGGIFVAAVLIVQGGRGYSIVSGARTAKLAQSNLAKAFKSGDFRRPS